MTQRVIVIYDETSGAIRQVTRCPETDAEAQHLAWEGCGFVDVTDTDPGVNPNDHAIDPQTMAIVARTLASDGDREAKRRELVDAAAAEIAAAAPADITALMLLAASGDVGAQSTAAALAATRDEAQQKLQGLLDTLSGAQTVTAIQAIAW